MASLSHVALMAQVPYEPAAIPEDGDQSVSTQVAAAEAGMLRDPAQNVDVHNTVRVIDRQGPTTGPDPFIPGTDRPALARDIGELVPFNGQVENLGTHVEFVAGSAYQPGDANPEPTFASRRNTYRLPPPPADNNLVLGE